MNIYKYSMLFILITGFIANSAVSLYADGYIRRLTGLSTSMDRMQEQKKEDDANYQKADYFLNSPGIKKDITDKDLIRICGEPVATAVNGSRWVYKPPTSTFFKGEKIYFYFDKNRKLVDWKKVSQK
jgi:hypothetical protein